MPVITKVSLAAALISSLFALSTVAQAQDHWDRDHDRDRVDHRYDRDHYDHHEHFVEQRPVYVAPRPMYVAPPVVMAPPVMMAPAGPPSLNLNFNVPL
jgi:hypothetical protein